MYVVYMRITSVVSIYVLLVQQQQSMLREQQEQQQSPLPSSM